mmetsp:Transcript_3607/g.8129  ORF Transcript_3607/g.8129 Transcript_3607/m.8129 type:complete len:400 (+) Transcript_3607:95-1294(+)
MHQTTTLNPCTLNTNSHRSDMAAGHRATNTRCHTPARRRPATARLSSPPAPRPSPLFTRQTKLLDMYSVTADAIPGSVPFGTITLQKRSKSTRPRSSGLAELRIAAAAADRRGPSGRMTSRSARVITPSPSASSTRNAARLSRGSQYWRGSMVAATNSMRLIAPLPWPMSTHWQMVSRSEGTSSPCTRSASAMSSAVSTPSPPRSCIRNASTCFLIASSSCGPTIDASTRTASRCSAGARAKRRSLRISSSSMGEADGPEPVALEKRCTTRGNAYAACGMSPESSASGMSIRIFTGPSWLWVRGRSARKRCCRALTAVTRAAGSWVSIASSRSHASSGARRRATFSRAEMNFAERMLVAASSTIVRSLPSFTLMTMRANSALDERLPSRLMSGSPTSSW